MKRAIGVLLLTVAVIVSTDALALKKAAPPPPPPPPVDGGTVQGGGDNMDACGAALCLAGVMMTGSNPDKCSGYIETYFGIIATKRGIFNPTKTATARLDFLKQCRSGDSQSQNNVNNRYGKSRGL